MAKVEPEQMILAQTTSPIGQPSDWSQFGLIGLVIFALFILLFSFGGFIVRRFGQLEHARDKADEQRQQFLVQCLQDHRKERDQYRQHMRQDSQENSEALRTLVAQSIHAINENTDAFREVRQEIRALVEKHQG